MSDNVARAAELIGDHFSIDAADDRLVRGTAIAQALADAGLLARELPTREEIAQAIEPAGWPDSADGNRINRHVRARARRQADAVLALLNGGGR